MRRKTKRLRQIPTKSVDYRQQILAQTSLKSETAELNWNGSLTTTTTTTGNSNSNSNSNNSNNNNYSPCCQLAQ